MSDPIWGPKGFYADKHAAERGHTITPSGNPYSPGSIAGKQARDLKDSGGGALPVSGASSGTVAGDVVGGIIFLGGVAVSFMSMIQSQNPLSFGGGLLLSTVSAVVIKWAIDSSSNDNNSSARIDPKEKINRDAKIKLEKTRLKKKALAMQCKELHGHFSNGVVRSYYASLSEKKQIDFKRFFNDAYIHSGTPTSDNRVKEIDTDRLFDKILEHTRNGKFLHNVILQESSFHQKLDNLLNGIHKYELKQERAEAKKVVLERKQTRYKRMTPYRKISNVVTPVLNGLITTGILTSLFFVVSQPQATVNNSPAYTHYVTATSLKVRDGAGTQFNTASAPLQNDECIKVKNFTNNGWARIVLENNRSGFVHGDYIKRRPSGHRCPK